MNSASEKVWELSNRGVKCQWLPRHTGTVHVNEIWTGFTNPISQTNGDLDKFYYSLPNQCFHKPNALKLLIISCVN
jgi:hypothetical protein